MNNSSITRIGVMLYALVIGFFGVNHFLNGTGMQNAVPRFLPYSKFWVYFTGLMLISAAIALLIGKQVKLAGLLLALFLILIVLTVHLPAVLSSDGESHVSLAMTNLVKDTGLAAAALIIAGRGD